MRLPRKYSMKHHAEFSRTRTKGQARGGHYLVVSTVTAPDHPHHTFGIIVTRKIGNAVTRNHLKRRIHAILARQLDQMTDDNGKKRHIVTVLRWKAPQATHEQLERDWVKQARRLGILGPGTAESST